MSAHAQMISLRHSWRASEILVLSIKSGIACDRGEHAALGAQTLNTSMYQIANPLPGTLNDRLQGVTRIAAFATRLHG